MNEAKKSFINEILGSQPKKNYVTNKAVVFFAEKNFCRKFFKPKWLWFTVF